MLKFETNEFGIKRCIVNTQNRWCEYRLISDLFDKHLIIETFDENRWKIEEVHETFTISLDFDTKNYYRMVEQEKDQITIFYFPIAMMFFGYNK